MKKLILEFLRYIAVGGVAFVADTGVMTLCKEIFFKENCTAFQMALCVTAGFITGLICNYILSSIFVFISKEQKEKSRSVRAFLIYAAVGVTGYILTQIGMWLGVMIVGSDGLWYVLIKCFVAALVTIWNYVGRKIFVYHNS